MLIETARTSAQILSCHPVMRQLRPHLADADAFVSQVLRQIESSTYELAFLSAGGAVRSTAGFRIWENLVDGKHLYIDDLVSDEAERSKGYGEKLFDWVAAYARSNGCKRLTLDSGVQRHGAHRFYLRKRMHIAGHHFSMDL
jgi:GNAT superfamily N-acetyltransferase